MHRYRDDRDRDERDRWEWERQRDRARGFAWPGDLDRGFAGGYGYRRHHDDRGRYGDRHLDRGYDRPRDGARGDRDWRFRDREYGSDSWHDDPWSRYRR